LYCPTGIISGC